MPKLDFPPLRLAVLNGLLGLKDRYAADPDLFKHEDCPYDDETVEALTSILQVKEVERIVEKTVQVKRERGRPKKGGVSEEDLAELEKEVRDLLTNLKAMEAGPSLDTNEKIQITKTKTTLIEKLLEMRERVMNVRRLSEFQTVVISVLDDLVDEDGRDAFLERIEPYTE
jgi:hypothetical protein